jgi:CDP-diacylglycerol---serine O-phosphatidyltransferase
MKRHVTAANLLSTGSLAAGFLAVVFAADERLVAAALAIAAAALLDAADGFVARRLGVSGRFGSHLDSLSDLVSFGVAPALMLHVGALQDLPVVGTLACIAFVVAGAWRLARFQLVDDPDEFIGLPIPPAGLVIALAALALPAVAALPLTLVLATLMVSPLRFPTLLAVARAVRQRAASPEPPAPAHGPPAEEDLERAGAHARRWQRARRRARGIRRPRLRTRR